MRTSSSLRTGSDRACQNDIRMKVSQIVGQTLCLFRRSFERADDIILRRIEEGAAKCALRDFRREEEISVTDIMVNLLD